MLASFHVPLADGCLNYPQISARKINHLPISLLEIHTLGHVFCALLLYCFWFQKPAGVEDPTIIDEQIARLLVDEQQSLRSSKSTDLVVARAQNIPHIAYDFNGTDILLQAATMAVTSAAYGGAHLAAWSFDFPTEIDAYIWKASSITMLVGSLGMPVWHQLVHQVL